MRSRLRESLCRCASYYGRADSPWLERTPQETERALTVDVDNTNRTTLEFAWASVARDIGVFQGILLQGLTCKVKQEQGAKARLRIAYTAKLL